MFQHAQDKQFVVDAEDGGKTFRIGQVNSVRDGVGHGGDETTGVSPDSPRYNDDGPNRERRHERNPDDTRCQWTVEGY